MAKPENEWTAEEIVEMAKKNHLWINRMSMIRPTDDMLADIGAWVLDQIKHTDMTDALVGASPVVYIRINAS